MTNPTTIAEFEAFICRECEHAAVKHAMYVGPCGSCWAEAKTICKSFKPKAEDEEAIDAIIARIEA